MRTKCLRITGQVPTFRSSCSAAASTFHELRKVIGTSKIMLLVPLFNLKFLEGICRLLCRNFKWAALVLAAVLYAGTADADELTGTLKKIKETGVINVGYRDTSIPFSYLDDNQKPIGFAIDICMKIVDAVKKELKLDRLTVEFNPVTSSG